MKLVYASLRSGGGAEVRFHLVFGIRKYFATASAFGMPSIVDTCKWGTRCEKRAAFLHWDAGREKRMGETWLRSLVSEGQLVKFV